MNEDTRQCSMSFPVTMGALVRGRMRMALGHLADYFKGEVEVLYREDKGFLSSEFAITLHGRHCDVKKAYDHLRGMFPS